MRSFILISSTCIFLFLCICSCQNPRREDDRKTVETTLSGTRMHSDMLMGRAFICTKDDNIFMRSFYPDSVAIIYSMSGDSLKRVRSFGIKGRGPFEFNDYPAFYFKDDSLYIMDESRIGDMLKLTVAGIDDIRNNDGYENWKEYDLQWLNPFMSGMSFAPVDSRHFLVLGDEHGKENLLTEIDIREKRKHPAGYWIADDYSGPAIPKQAIYLSNSEIAINDSLLVFAAGEGRYMEILRLGADGSLSHRCSIYDIPPVYEATPDGLNYKPVIPSYRGMDIRATERFIYAVLNQYNPEYKEYKGYPWYCSDEVEVYGWNGDFITCFATDTPFYDFIVSDDDKTLLTITQDPASGEPTIYRYALRFNE